MLTTVAAFRDFDALGAFTDLEDPQIAAELEAAEQVLLGYVQGRGYGAFDAANVAVHRAIFKIARVELVAIRGSNPADPAHALLIHERDRAEEWFRKWIASGQANLVGTNAPTRARTGIAGVYTADSESDTTERGW